MNENSLKVFINKEHSGKLTHEEQMYVFNYNDDATSVVSLTMPIRGRSWNSKKLHPIFEMNMPEGALREAIKNHFAKIQQMDDLNFLKLIGPYMLGRVKFGEIVKTEENLKLDEILHTQKESLFEELMQRFAIRSGVSGVQPKILLSAQNKTTMKFEHFIVKSWETSYPQLALNEYFCMRAIQNANLPTPEFYLSDDLSMFIMKRFDIKEDESYLGFEDMCVLTARATEEKYSGSYEEILKVIKDVIEPQKRKESIKIFFMALIMNHLLKNGDAHLKNYGVLYERDYEDATLAPIYDVITTTLYIKNDIPALKLRDAKLWFKEKTYRDFATKSCGLSTKEYENMLEVCYDAITKTKKEIDSYESSDKEVLEFLEKLKNIWLDKI
ncbi:MAG TPA: type II toxin-antitoxin system HipA family toxin [Sulfurimonas sp.]|uniref:type II toxin-antitoxin system HipA family toxin n=1 Tax=Sulfurimonas sp. TaxID=2022749 RepID=UPI002D125405|nr:type II toxin-antitoxin system HipA family toxin [Sulfurimonas sp.]HUH41580.1 type II toxin-antitoxin system HipA family toxin [Sulfurimonas sp.]